MTATSRAFTTFTTFTTFTNFTNFTYQPRNLMFNRINDIKTIITYSLSLPKYSKFTYIIKVLYNNDIRLNNNIHFRKLLIDLNDYDTLKELKRARIRPMK